ncbi:uncharacterized protein LOC122532274 [Frieseomelitta varia]|uniref:uncharacterized protein LOC122532274 n=1 Tax=Frieseomelitta varia TaxID=561572 RepID=UPI001CB6A72B|nr:uncharacterized protein LOC122532274 [Frieseomelitta varia]
MVWRKQNREFELKNLKGTVKHGWGSVMVWGCMAANGVGNLVFIDGIMDKMNYLNILWGHLSSSATKLQLVSNYYFQHDNDSKHTAYIVKQWALYNTPHVLSIPPQSPDVNPIENLWTEIERRLKKIWEDWYKNFMEKLGGEKSLQSGKEKTVITGEVSDLLEAELTVKEIELQITRLKKKKAAGIDGMPNEAWIYSTGSTRERLKNITLEKNDDLGRTE